MSHAAPGILMSTSNSTSLSTSLIMHAPPERVRAVLLDFENLPKWKNRQNLILGVRVHRAVAGSEGKVTVAGVDAKVGDIVVVQSPQAGEQRAEVFVNTPTQFGYKCTFAGCTAHHWWEFLSHPPGCDGTEATLLRHCESYEGGLAVLLWWPSPLRWYLRRLFEGFNRDLKDELERKERLGGEGKEVKGLEWGMN